MNCVLIFHTVVSSINLSKIILYHINNILTIILLISITMIMFLFCLYQLTKHIFSLSRLERQVYYIAIILFRLLHSKEAVLANSSATSSSIKFPAVVSLQTNLKIFRRIERIILVKV